MDHAGRLSKLQRRLTLLRDSAAMLGPLDVLQRSLAYLLRDRDHLDPRFDRRHGTDTVGLVRAEALGVHDPIARAQAVYYVPSPERVTRHLLGQLELDEGAWSFVDVGCGKGRVLMLASELPFREVIGVEISPSLAAVARANLQRYRGAGEPAKVRVEELDARSFTFPANDLVLHFFHPFGALLLRTVLSNLERSWRAAPRRVTVLYLSIGQETLEVFERFPFLQLQRYVPCLESRYAWAHFQARDGTRPAAHASATQGS